MHFLLQYCKTNPQNVAVIVTKRKVISFRNLKYCEFKVTIEIKVGDSFQCTIQPSQISSKVGELSTENSILAKFQHSYVMQFCGAGV
jgi:hypothetical protein